MVTKKTNVIKQVVCYNAQAFIQQLCDTVALLEGEGYETELHYAMSGEKYSALVVGKKSETDTKTQGNTKKAK